jgi:hypothetical protein
VRNCYPSFTAQFDTLHEDQVIWQPYTAEEMARRYPRGISNLCTRDHIYWMTKVKIIFDIFVEEMSQQRVMRQFGRRQLANPVRPDRPLESHVHE